MRHQPSFRDSLIARSCSTLRLPWCHSNSPVDMVPSALTASSVASQYPNPNLRRSTSPTAWLTTSTSWSSQTLTSGCSPSSLATNRVVAPASRMSCCDVLPQRDVPNLVKTSCVAPMTSPIADAVRARAASARSARRDCQKSSAGPVIATRAAPVPLRIASHQSVVIGTHRSGSHPRKGRLGLWCPGDTLEAAVREQLGEVS